MAKWKMSKDGKEREPLDAAAKLERLEEDFMNGKMSREEFTKAKFEFEKYFASVAEKEKLAFYEAQKLKEEKAAAKWAERKDK